MRVGYYGKSLEGMHIDSLYYVMICIYLVDSHGRTAVMPRRSSLVTFFTILISSRFLGLEHVEIRACRSERENRYLFKRAEEIQEEPKENPENNS